MARKRNFIGVTETGKLSALGNQKQRDFNFIAGLLNDPNISKYFAEPSVREDSQNIDWYTEAEGKVKGFNDFTPNEVSQLKRELTSLFHALEDKRKASDTEFDQETIRNLTMLPDEASIKKVGDQFVIINWAYKLHKKEKSEKTPENFAGLVDDANEDENIPNQDEQKPTKPSTGQSKSSETTDDAVDDNEPIDQDLGATLDEDQGVEEEKDNRETKPEKSSSPLFQKKWLWIAIFLFLLLLNVLMLKDACGVRSIPFLYFC